MCPSPAVDPGRDHPPLTIMLARRLREPVTSALHVRATTKHKKPSRCYLLRRRSMTRHISGRGIGLGRQLYIVMVFPLVSWPG